MTPERQKILTAYFEKHGSTVTTFGLSESVLNKIVDEMQKTLNGERGRVTDADLAELSVDETAEELQAAVF